MISDFEEYAASSAQTEPFDLCIIGGGAAGLCLAEEFRGSGLKVVILDGGRDREDSESQELYRCDYPERAHPSSFEGRWRRFGGSTTHWAGQALRFAEADFADRPWVPHSHWPVSYDEVAGFYPRAEEFLLLDSKMGYGEDLAASRGVPSFGLDEADFVEAFSRYSPGPDLRKTYGPRLAGDPDTTVLLGANLVDISLNSSGDQVVDVGIEGFGGGRRRIAARQFVLACGGVENARILLATGAVGDGAENVGRYFQDHPTGTVAELGGDASALHQRGAMYRRGLGRDFKARISSTLAHQEKHEALSVSAAVVFDLPEGPVTEFRDAVNERKNGAALKACFGLLRRPQLLFTPLTTLIRQGRVLVPGGIARLEVSTEQEPDADSRIELSSDEVDRFGLPKAIVRWRVSNRPARAVLAFLEELQTDFARLGFGDVKPTVPSYPDDSAWDDILHDNNHHIGSTRMSSSPSDGVVDSECRVFGIENLSVAGSSVFTTGSHANPTLTLLALAIRLGDRVKAELTREARPLQISPHTQNTSSTLS